MPGNERRIIVFGIMPAEVGMVMQLPLHLEKKFCQEQNAAVTLLMMADDITRDYALLGCWRLHQSRDLIRYPAREQGQPPTMLHPPPARSAVHIDGPGCRQQAACLALAY
jgi:hypothetical protein